MHDMRRISVVLMAVGVLAVATPARAQITGISGPRYPYSNNPVDRVYQDVQKPLPRLPAAPPPATRWVPEQRAIDPGTRQEVVIPAHEERRVTDTQVHVPTLPAYSPSGPAFIPGGDRPPAELRPAP
jgi:hypothetical protein